MNTKNCDQETNRVTTTNMSKKEHDNDEWKTTTSRLIRKSWLEKVEKKAMMMNEKLQLRDRQGDHN
jgi:hypothetical protein